MRNSSGVDVNFVLLADRLDAAEVVAKWYFDEWGQKIAGMTRESVAAKVRGSLNKDRIPLIVLAIEEGETVGAAELKYREMDIYPEKEHWLGGVFVAPHERGRGILYSRPGWKPLERVRHKGIEVLVMARPLDVQSRAESDSLRGIAAHNRLSARP
jgi:hypothetical protein